MICLEIKHKNIKAWNTEIYLFNTSRNQSLEVDHSVYIILCWIFPLLPLIAHYSFDYYFAEWILINKIFIINCAAKEEN